jgi:Tfp pilus assembly protein PilE
MPMTRVSGPLEDDERASVRILRQFQSSSGQGLLEVVLVVAFFSAVVAVATPVYLGFQDRKAEKAAKANLVAATHIAGAYRQDSGSYAGMDSLDLYKIDPRVSTSLSVAWTKRGAYCLTDNVHGKTWSLRAPYKRDPKFFANGTCE